MLTRQKESAGCQTSGKASRLVGWQVNKLAMMPLGKNYSLMCSLVSRLAMRKARMLADEQAGRQTGNGRTFGKVEDVEGRQGGKKEIGEKGSVSNKKNLKSE